MSTYRFSATGTERLTAGMRSHPFGRGPDGQREEPVISGATSAPPGVSGPSRAHNPGHPHRPTALRPTTLTSSPVIPGPALGVVLIPRLRHGGHVVRCGPVPRGERIPRRNHFLVDLSRLLITHRDRRLRVT